MEPWRHSFSPGKHSIKSKIREQDASAVDANDVLPLEVMYCMWLPRRRMGWVTFSFFLCASDSSVNTLKSSQSNDTGTKHIS